MLQITLLFLLGFAILTFAAERFVTGASALARNLGISPLIIGLTIVAFGTSAPELLVGTVAALHGQTGLAIGNALGSNITNIGLGIGLTALIKPLAVNSKTLKREYPILFGFMVLTVLLMWGNQLTRLDGVVLIIGLVGFLIWLVKVGKQGGDETLAHEFTQELPSKLSTPKAVLWLIVGCVLLPFGSDLLVNQATALAKLFGISDVIIGLTVIAIGTSLPEIATAIIGALKNEPDIAVGNIIGSNIFNLLSVLAVPVIIHPASFNPLVLYRDVSAMFIFTVLLFLTAYGFRGRPGRVNRWEGSVLVLCYIGYLALLSQSLH